MKASLKVKPSLHRRGLEVAKIVNQSLSPTSFSDWEHTDSGKLVKPPVFSGEDKISIRDS